MTQKVVSLKDGKKAATAKVEILNAKGMKVGDADFAYSLNSVGALKVKVTFRPDTAVVKSMARLGLTFEMNDTYGNVAYLGRGDNETYSDRMQSGKIALYQTTAERMFHYYVTPQSTGNRTDDPLDEADGRSRTGHLCRFQPSFPVQCHLLCR